MRGAAAQERDGGRGKGLGELLEELGGMLGANGAGEQAEEEAGAATVRGVGRSPDGREVLPVAEAMV